MHLWSIFKSVWWTEEQFQLFFTVTVRDIYIPVVYWREHSCTRSANAMFLSSETELRWKRSLSTSLFPVGPGAGSPGELCTGPLPLYPANSPSAYVVMQGEMASFATGIWELNFIWIKFNDLYILIENSFRSLMVRFFTSAYAFSQKHFGTLFGDWYTASRSLSHVPHGQSYEKHGCKL